MHKSNIETFSSIGWHRVTLERWRWTNSKSWQTEPMHLLLSHLVGAGAEPKKKPGLWRTTPARDFSSSRCSHHSSTIVNNCPYRDAIRFQFHRLSVFEVIKQIVSSSHSKPPKKEVCRISKVNTVSGIPADTLSMSRIIYACVEGLRSVRIWNCFLLLPTHVSPLPVFLKLENKCSVRISYDTTIGCFVQQ